MDVRTYGAIAALLLAIDLDLTMFVYGERRLKILAIVFAVIIVIDLVYIGLMWGSDE